jgi:hypothetical protein
MSYEGIKSSARAQQASVTSKPGAVRMWHALWPVMAVSGWAWGLVIVSVIAGALAELWLVALVGLVLSTSLGLGLAVIHGRIQHGRCAGVAQDQSAQRVAEVSELARLLCAAAWSTTAGVVCLYCFFVVMPALAGSVAIQRAAGWVGASLEDSGATLVVGIVALAVSTLLWAAWLLKARRLGGVLEVLSYFY